MTSAEHQKKLRNDHKLKGLCILCSQPATPGTVYCEFHSKYMKNKHNQYRAEKKSRGICVDCFVPAKKGYTRCTQHLDKDTFSSIKLHNKRKEEGKCPACGVPLEETEGITCTNCIELRVRQKAYSTKI